MNAELETALREWAAAIRADRAAQDKWDRRRARQQAMPLWEAMVDAGAREEKAAATVRKLVLSTYPEADAR